MDKLPQRDKVSFIEVKTYVYIAWLMCRVLIRYFLSVFLKSTRIITKFFIENISIFLKVTIIFCVFHSGINSTMRYGNHFVILLECNSFARVRVCWANNVCLKNDDVIIQCDFCGLDYHKSFG